MAKARLITQVSKIDTAKQNVAAYCRVSTNAADQLNSYATQIRTYTKLLNSKPEWNMVEIFADEGLSGTKASNRTEFQRMIKMCELRQIDLIITKSVSRFARNVPEALEYVRKLKLIGVGVQFEKEGINTLAMGDEMLLNTFAAIAQEESQAISQNQRLANAKRMERGEYISSSAPYGYRLVDKEMTIHEEEAKCIRWIFDAYLQGWSTTEIAKQLSKDQIPTKTGSGNWTSNRVKYILTNERYIGDSKYQKTYGETTVPFKRFINHGEEDMYYVKGTHVPLIDIEKYEKVQVLLEKRQNQFTRNEAHIEYPLTSRIRCSECGSFYRRKIRGGVVKWVCHRHIQNARSCQSSYYSEERIYDALASMINKLRFSEPDIIGQVITRLECASLEYKRSNKTAGDISRSIADINAKLMMLEQLRSKGYLDADVYQSQALDLKNQLSKLKGERTDIFESQILGMLEKVKQLKMLLDELEEPMESFDERFLVELIEDISINKNDEMTVTVLGGLRFKELI